MSLTAKPLPESWQTPLSYRPVWLRLAGPFDGTHQVSRRRLGHEIPAVELRCRVSAVVTVTVEARGPTDLRWQTRCSITGSDFGQLLRLEGASDVRLTMTGTAEGTCELLEPRR